MIQDQNIRSAKAGLMFSAESGEVVGAAGDQETGPEPACTRTCRFSMFALDLEKYILRSFHVGRVADNLVLRLVGLFTTEKPLWLGYGHLASLKRGMNKLLNRRLRHLFLTATLKTNAQTTPIVPRNAANHSLARITSLDDIFDVAVTALWPTANSPPCRFRLKPGRAQKSQEHTHRTLNSFWSGPDSRYVEARSSDLGLCARLLGRTSFPGPSKHHVRVLNGI
jgi:hypothetical protein